MKILILTAMIVLWSAVSFAQKKDEVTVSSSDGAAFKGTFYSAEKTGPGVLLLNQCNSNRQVYEHLGGMVTSAGYNALAIDSSDANKMGGDVDAGLKFLASQSVVNATALAIVAATVERSRSKKRNSRSDLVRPGTSLRSLEDEL